jgi:hypothetical protein
MSELAAMQVSVAELQTSSPLHSAGFSTHPAPLAELAQAAARVKRAKPEMAYIHRYINDLLS